MFFAKKEPTELITQPRPSKGTHQTNHWEFRVSLRRSMASPWETLCWPRWPESPASACLLHLKSQTSLARWMVMDANGIWNYLKWSQHTLDPLRRSKNKSRKEPHCLSPFCRHQEPVWGTLALGQSQAIHIISMHLCLAKYVCLTIPSGNPT